MTGINASFKDGISARITEIQIQDTYRGLLAGTFTVATRHRLLAIASQMDEIQNGAKKGYYYLAPELVDEAELRGLSNVEASSLRRRTEVGKCLKDMEIKATIQVSDEDYCHIIDLVWFQSGKELAETPVSTLVQNAVSSLTYNGEISKYTEDVDWLDMY